MFCRSQEGKDEMRVPARAQQMQEAMFFKPSKPNEVQKVKDLFNQGRSKLEIAETLAASAK